MIREIQKGKQVEVHTGRAGFTSATLSHPDELITYRDEITQGNYLEPISLVGAP